MEIGRAKAPSHQKGSSGSLPALPDMLREVLATGLRSKLAAPIRSSRTCGFLASSDREAIELLSAFAVSKGGRNEGLDCVRLIADSLRTLSPKVSCKLPYDVARETAFFPAFHSIEVLRTGSAVQVVLGSGEMSECSCTPAIFARRLSVSETCSFKLLPIPNCRGAVCVDPEEIAEAVSEAKVEGYTVQRVSGGGASLSMQPDEGRTCTASLRVIYPSSAKIVEANGAFAIAGDDMGLRSEFQPRLVVQVFSGMAGQVPQGDISNLKAHSTVVVSAATALIAAVTSVAGKESR